MTYPLRQPPVDDDSVMENPLSQPPVEDAGCMESFMHQAPLGVSDPNDAAWSGADSDAWQGFDWDDASSWGSAHGVGGLPVDKCSAA